MPSDSVSHWTGSLSFWLTSQQVPGIFLPLSPSVGIMDMHDCAWLFHRVIEDSVSVPHAYMEVLFPTKSSPQHLKILSMEKCAERNKFPLSQREKEVWLSPLKMVSQKKAPWNTDSNTDLPLRCFKKQTLLSGGYFLCGYRSRQKELRVENEDE